MIKLFLENLSYRMFKENDVSDITWALCNTSPRFRDYFLHYFFPEMQVEKNVTLDREISKDDSRVDFIIHNKNETYIIENKINDKNHHFGVYEETYNVLPERFGYIANYKIEQPTEGKNYAIRTWKDFYNHLQHLKSDDKIEQELIGGYKTYLQNVCNIIPYEVPMNTNGIYSLFALIEVLSELCERNENNFKIEHTNIGCNYTGGYKNNHKELGIMFKLTFKKISFSETYGWIGIYFERKEPLICIGFYDKENWAKKLCRILNDKPIPTGKLSSESYSADGGIWFNFAKHDELNKCSSIEEQKNLLKEYMDEVIEKIYKLIITYNNGNNE